MKKPIFVDGTLGLAGHTISLLKHCNNNDLQVIGIDKDEKALKIAEKKIFSCNAKNKYTFIHDDFNNFKNIQLDCQIQSVHGILLDLGVSSMQLDDKARGFSFLDLSAPLDMRMNQYQTKDAAEIINNYSQNDLEKILKNGEERHFRKIAYNICQFRKSKEIKRVGDLVEIIKKSVPNKYHRTHFATDTFRAIRLEVNDEISKLNSTIDEMVLALYPGARLAIITFHSLEDRIVKNKFKQLVKPCICPPKSPICVCGLRQSVRIVTKKPITPSNAETQNNPRARSAKLRIAEKL